MNGAVSPRGFSSYKEAIAWLYRTQRYGIKLGLENVARLFRQLQVPAEQQRIIHVAGTNGKGSVCAMIASICRAQGYRTGLFTSPHLVTFRERIQVNGEMISEAAVAKGFGKIREIIREWKTHPTFFEITTALALLHFKERECEVIALETGLGGRLDATNAIMPVVSVITPIALDHQSWLGNTLEEIAREKAGIIKEKIPVASAKQELAAEQVIRARAAECESPIEFVSEPFASSPLALAGAHQARNASLALAALRLGGIRVEENAIAQGLANVGWPARFQRWDEQIIIDGAHNPAGAHVLAETWRETFGDERATIIFAALQDKDLTGIWRTLTLIARTVFLPHIRSERAVLPNELLKVVREVSPDLPVSVASSFDEALNLARSQRGKILITGSLHFAGEALAALKGVPTAYEECSQ